MIQPTHFTVNGLPIAQGSMKVFNGRIVHVSGPALKAWRDKIAWTALSVGFRATDEPVRLTLAFTLARPKTVTREFPTVVPDLDKFVRSVGDALTGVVFRDDSQVVDIIASKRYGAIPGVEIEIKRL